MKALKETHVRGFLSVEAHITSLLDCDFGIQIAEDGRVWIYLNGAALLKFKPHPKKGERLNTPNLPAYLHIPA